MNTESPRDDRAATARSLTEEKSFRGWRLLGVLALVVLVLAIVSAAVDVWVLGPLLERF